MTKDVVEELKYALMVDKSPWDATLYEKAIDEIENLRKELQRSSLQANIMRNIALTPLDEHGQKIELLLADRDRWKHIAWLGHKVIFSKWEYTQFEQAYEEAMDDEV